MPKNWQPDPQATVADFCLNPGEIGELDLTAVPEADVAAVWPEVAHSEWCQRPFQRGVPAGLPRNFAVPRDVGPPALAQRTVRWTLKPATGQDVVIVAGG